MGIWILVKRCHPIITETIKNEVHWRKYCTLYHQGINEEDDVGKNMMGNIYQVDHQTE